MLEGIAGALTCFPECCKREPRISGPEHNEVSKDLVPEHLVTQLSQLAGRAAGPEDAKQIPYQAESPEKSALVVAIACHQYSLCKVLNGAEVQAVSLLVVLQGLRMPSRFPTRQSPPTSQRWSWPWPVISTAYVRS